MHYLLTVQYQGFQRPVLLLIYPDRKNQRERLLFDNGVKKFLPLLYIDKVYDVKDTVCWCGKKEWDGM